MFKFLFGRTRGRQLYRVLYVLKGSDFFLTAVVAATSEYEAQREFDRLYPTDYVRIPYSTKLVS